ncbi:MAG: 6-phosphogluconolactonase [Thermoleophilaceae bacterium]
MEVRVLEDPSAACAELLAAAAERGEHIALTGGSTPAIAYEKAAAMGADWSKATLWWGDERCVPPENELSNFAMAKHALLDRLPGGSSGPTAERIRGELGPGDGADDYERRLRRAFADTVPRLDFLLLGLGPDAHVASLFPGQATLSERERAVAGVEHAGHEPYVPRVTLTFPVLCAAREIVFLVAGEGKARAVERAFGGGPDVEAPGSLVRPSGDGRLTLLLDRPAAALLGGSA